MAVSSSSILEVAATRLLALHNSTTHQCSPIRKYSSQTRLIFNLVYLTGAVGNAAALFYLVVSKSKPKNPKHLLMLRCLAASDLLAVVGMWGQMNVHMYYPDQANSRQFCCLRTLWRIFGLGSGCIVIVMAVERWFALTRPFFYQKYVTLSMIRRSIIVLWLMVLVVVCLPFLGFGLYYDEKCGRCKRYKLATKPLDIAYAYVYMVFGSLLCLCLVVCNVAVMKALVLTKQSMLKRKAVLVRRISRNKDLTLSSSTSEETAFAKIMALFCLTFVVCWLPQLITVPLGMMYPGKASSETFFKVADGLLAAHFIADPYLYILQRWPVFRQLCRRGKGSRVNSVKTSNELYSL